MESIEKIEHKLARIQFGVFFNRPINRPDLISSSVLQQFQSEFDAPPTNLPLPPDAPVDIPISQLKSKSGAWNLDVSKIRAGVVFSPENVGNSENEVSIENIKKVILLCADKAREQNIDINRIVNFAVYILYPNKPIEFLQEKLRIKKFNNTIELSIRFNQKEKKDDFSMNNITMIENGFEEKDGKKNNVLILTKDVNNIFPNENKFLDKDIEKFFSITKNIVSWEKSSKIFE